MNEQERINILQKLSSGEISAEEAARLLSGETGPTPTIEIEVEVQAEPSDEPVEMMIEHETVMDEQDAPETPDVPDTPDVQVEIRQGADGEEAKQLRISAVEQHGHLDFDIVIPIPLLKLGKQIGGRFAPTLTGWDWRTLELDIDMDTLHVRVSAE